MEKISPTTARTRLDRVRLTVSDREALHALLAELGTDTDLSVERAQEVLFAGRTAAAATKALERLVKQVNAAAEEDGVDLRLEVRGAKRLGPRRRLGFVAEHIDPAGDPLREHKAVRDNLITDRQATLLGPRRIVLCHAPKDAKLAGQLWDELIEALDCDRSGLTVWRADQDVLAGEDAGHQFRAKVAEGDLVVIALSNAWFGQDPARDEALAHAAVTGVRLAPVRLKALSPGVDTSRFGTTFYPDAPDAKAFAALRGDNARSEWVHGLVEQAHRLLTRPAARAATPDLRDRRMLKAGRNDGYFALQAQPGTMEPNATYDVQSDARRVDDVASFLLNWARDPNSTPLAALLGEYGAGKTITCQELTERLKADPVTDRPEPLYFDLRRVGNLDRGVPTLTEILTECINRGWTSGDAPLPTGEEVLARARRRPTLFIIDGLDEVLVRLDAAQGVTFTHELLKLRPIRTRDGWHAPFAAIHTKLLLSCRTHYFRSLRAQSRHFLEHDRGLTSVEDYTALILLPLKDEQIHSYLDKTLDRDASQVMDMLRAVHDLSDLATRPYTLAKVAEQVPFIEQRLAEQRSVHAATIYRQVLHDWLARDHGKHRLRPDHKLKLMARLAAWSWQRGDRRVDSTDLDDWLDEQLATDNVLRRRYQDISRDQLEEDLRTATFVTRSDDSGPDRPDFQFAHSSIHEYFLAQHLCDALRDNRRQDWCLPMPSDETLDFLGQLIADDDNPDELIVRLGEWRAPYMAQASELWLRYHLQARAQGWRHSSLAGCDLTGASLRGWPFIGTETAPLTLTACTLVGADLRDTRWDHVVLSNGDLDSARLGCATLHHVTLRTAKLRGADLTGAFLHCCQLDGADLRDAITDGLRHVGSGDGLPTPVLPSRTCVQSIVSRGASVDEVAFSPDGTRLATVTDGIAHVWDGVTEEPLVTLAHLGHQVQAVAFSPDGTRLATTNDNATADIWSLAGELLLTISGLPRAPRKVIFSPDSTRLAITSDEESLYIWNSTTGEHLLTIGGETAEVFSAAFSPDGAHVATADADGAVRIWNSTTGENLLTISSDPHALQEVVFGPDGARLATTSSDGAVHIWSSTTGENLLTIPSHGGASFYQAAFSPDGARLATTSSDGAVHIWNSTTGQNLLKIGGAGRFIYQVGFSPEGTRLTSTGVLGETHIWDSFTGERLRTLRARAAPALWGVTFSPDGTRLVTVGEGGAAHIWHSVTGERTATLAERGTGTWWAAAFSPDGTRLATVGHNGIARIWNSTTGEHVLTLTGHTQTLRGVAFSPDGTRLATTSDDETVCVWNSTTGQNLLTVELSDEVREDFDEDDEGGYNGVNSVLFSPDGSLLVTAGDDGVARVWNSTSGEALLTLVGHTRRIWSAALSPDMSRLATASEDGTTRIWDSSTGEQLLTLTGRHAGEMNSVAFSPDGTLLATADDGGEARVWDSSTGQLLWLTAHFPDGAGASWSPAENRLYAVTGDAWRYLRAACYDENNRLLGLQPYERHYDVSHPDIES